MFWQFNSGGIGIEDSFDKLFPSFRHYQITCHFLVKITPVISILEYLDETEYLFIFMRSNTTNSNQS